MATTTIADMAYIPEVFNGYVTNIVETKSTLFSSDAVRYVDAMVPLYGREIHLPAWNTLAGGANVLSDTVCQTSTALTSYDTKAPILERGKVFSVNGLVSSFAGANPFDRLGGEVGAFWAKELDTAAINAALGASAGIQADGTNVVLDITAASGAASKITAAGIIQARALAGEYMNDFDILVLSPAVYASLQTQDLTQFIPNSQGQLIETFMGMRVIMSSVLPVVSGNYTSLLVRSGAFGYAENTDPRKAVEFDRDVKCNDDIMSVQKRFVVHPWGATFDGSIAGATATNAELATASKWSLAGPVENFGIRVLKSKI